MWHGEQPGDCDAGFIVERDRHVGAAVGGKDLEPSGTNLRERIHEEGAEAVEPILREVEDFVVGSGVERGELLATPTREPPPEQGPLADRGFRLDRRDTADDERRVSRYRRAPYPGPEGASSLTGLTVVGGLPAEATDFRPYTPWFELAATTGVVLPRDLYHDL